MPDAPVWLNTKTAAAYLGMTPVTLYRLVDRGDVAGYLTGRVCRYRQEDLDRFLEDARTGRRDGTRQSPTVENRRRSEQNPSHLDDDLGSNPPSHQRRERDSNPRDPRGPTGFQDQRIRPLCHPSEGEAIGPRL